jgi:hypothetical protein
MKNIFLPFTIVIVVLAAVILLAAATISMIFSVAASAAAYVIIRLLVWQESIFLIKLTKVLGTTQFEKEIK